MMAAARQNLTACVPLDSSGNRRCFALRIVSIYLLPLAKQLVNIKGVAHEQKYRRKTNLAKCTAISVNQHESIDIITPFSGRCLD